MKTPRSVGRLVAHAWLLLALGVQLAVSAQAPGTVDRSFNPGPRADYGAGPVAQSSVFALLPLPDGRVYVGGTFQVLGGVFCQQLGRLAPDGSVDPSFNVGTGFDNPVSNPPREMTNGGWVSSLVVRNDGKLLVSGNFTRVNGLARNGLVLLYPDGSVVTAYDAAAHCAGGRVSGVIALPGDQVLIRGGFTNVWDQPRVGLARLQPDGTVHLCT